MALKYLVDTSVLQRLGRMEVRAVIEPLAVSRQLGRPQTCDLEVGYSARNVNEWDHLVRALDAFDAVETRRRTFAGRFRYNICWPSTGSVAARFRPFGRGGGRRTRRRRTPL